MFEMKIHTEAIYDICPIVGYKIRGHAPSWSIGLDPGFVISIPILRDEEVVEQVVKLQPPLKDTRCWPAKNCDIFSGAETWGSKLVCLAVVQVREFSSKQTWHWAKQTATFYAPPSRTAWNWTWNACICRKLRSGTRIFFGHNRWVSNHFKTAQQLFAGVSCCKLTNCMF